MATETKDKGRKKNPKNYFKEIKNELKKVVWPTKEQLKNYTITVLVFTFVVGGIIAIFDYGVFNLLKQTGFIQ